MKRELFQKYVNNTCTPEEKEEVLAWLKSSENKEEILKELDQYWHTDSGLQNRPDIDSEMLFDRVLNTLQERSLIDSKTSTDKASNSRSLFSFVFKYAAIFILLIAASISFLYYYTYTDKPIEVVSEVPEEPLKQRKEPKIQEILLSDGTKVWLNARSSLKYPKEFTGSSREVYLEGEAYFEVVKNPAKPFIVRTSALDVKVLGTTFNVKSYKEDENIEATLAEGKISIDLHKRKSGSDLVLVPAEGIVYSKKNVDVKKLRNMDVRSVISWKEGVLYFKNETFAEVEKKLERWYGVEIVSENISTSDFRFTAKFEGETFEEVMKFINLTIPISYTITGNKVLVKYKR